MREQSQDSREFLESESITVPWPRYREDGSVAKCADRTFVEPTEQALRKGKLLESIEQLPVLDLHCQVPDGINVSIWKLVVHESYVLTEPNVSISMVKR
jgi:hypothetical protein